MCRNSLCSVFTAVDGTIPSDAMAFACHLTPDAGSCTVFDYVIDTVEAAVNAKIDASNSNNEALIHSVDAQRLVVDVQAEDVLVNEELYTIDSVRDQMTPEEQDEIFSNASLIKDSVTRCARNALNISLEANEAYDKNLKTADFARNAIQAERDGRDAEHKLEEEEEKAKMENRDCSVCIQLQGDIERLKQLRRDAAVNAGNSARACAKNKDATSIVLKEIHETRVNCGFARAKVLTHIAKLKARLGLP
ncbi:hypothetical protein FGB62_89g00 [Gracilaria domingensis]|nr:hypothetical protein FGB62_89g00 [Gracilaria domingensis]